ncbi:MAG: TIGR00730 family Rossman fold protein [bacterium]|nr:TIGR00730 family Rossman fold protein [bacterium]
MNILIFCSAQDVPEKYTKVAAEFSALLARKGHVLVWGGSDRGTMKVIADAAQDAGGKIIGISMEFFKHKVRENADEIIIAPDLSERKKLMLKRSDAIVALAGGIGTLDETTEMLALKRHGDHDKPIVFLNTDDFYQGMKRQLEKMEEDGFLKNIDSDVVGGPLAYFADTTEEAMSHLESYCR